MISNQSADSKVITVVNRDGFVLVAALIFLVILTVMGMSASSSMQVEMMISKNDRLAKEVFYGAEGGLDIGIEMAAENLACAGGFSTNRTVNGLDTKVISGAEVVDLDFVWEDPPEDINSLNLDDNNSDLDIVIPRLNPDGTSQTVHANIVVRGEYIPADGSSIVILASYDENGGSLASTGVYEFTVLSQQFGLDDSSSLLSQKYGEKAKDLYECKHSDLKH